MLHFAARPMDDGIAIIYQWPVFLASRQVYSDDGVTRRL